VAGGARLLLLPEYASLELVSLLPEGVWNDVRAQRPLMQRFLPGMLDLHARLARQHGIYLVAASYPTEAAAGHYVNRAYFFSPDGTHQYQDKQLMTRFEAEEWGIEPGEGLQVFSTELGVLGINICYDSEFPHLAQAQAAAGMEVLLVPSFTGSAHGYTRVRVGAMARALEGQIYAVRRGGQVLRTYNSVGDLLTSADMYAPVQAVALLNRPHASGPAPALDGSHGNGTPLRPGAHTLTTLN